jgi:hypothetical protein
MPEIITGKMTAKNSLRAYGSFAQDAINGFEPAVGTFGVWLPILDAFRTLAAQNTVRSNHVNSFPAEAYG